MRPILIAATLFLLAIPLPADDEGTPVFAVVAHPEVALDAVAAEDLRKIFLGLKGDVDGVELTPVVGTGGEVHRAFLREIVAKSITGFRLYWRKQIFSGAGNLPASFADPNALAAYIRLHPGTIGYLAAGADTTDPEVLEVRR